MGPASVLAERELWLAVGSGLLVIWRVLLPGSTLYLRDLSSYFLIQKRVLAQLVAGGELPLWNPFVQGGQGFLSCLASSVLAPANLLLLVASPVRAINLMVALHLALGLGGAYLLARRLGVGRGGSLVSALVFGLCGPTLSLVNLLNHFMAWTLLPLVAAAWLWCLEGGGRRGLAATVALAILQVFCGSPELTALTMVLLLLLGVALRPRTGFAGRLGRWVCLVVLVAAGAAVQLLPTAEIVAASARGFGMSFADLSAWSLSPRRLPELVLPWFLGHVDVLGADAYWGWRIVHDGVPYLFSIYLGVSAVGLAAAGALGRAAGTGGDRAWSRTLRWGLVGLVALGVLLSLGRHLPWARGAFELLPALWIARYPSKALLIAVLPLALLAGRGSETAPRRPPRVLVGGLAVAAALLLGLCVAAPSSFLGVLGGWFRTPADPAMLRGVAAAAAHAAAVGAALSLMLGRQVLGRPWRAVVLPLVVLVDLGAAGLRVNPVCDPSLLEAEPAAAAAARPALDGGRLYRAAGPAARTLSLPTEDAAWRHRWNLEVLGSATGAAWGIPQIFHPDVVQLSPVPLMRLAYFVERVPWEQRLPVLAAANVTVVMSDRPLAVEGLEPVARVEVMGDRPQSLYRVSTAAPRVGFVSEWRWLSDDVAAFDAMARSPFDPRREVVLVGRRPAGSAAPVAGVPEFSLQVDRPSFHRQVVSVSADRPGYLVFAEVDYPGWQVLVDGKQVPVERANLAFSAVFLEAGVHRVVRSYQPLGLLVGAGVSGVAALLLVGLWCGGRRPAAGAACSPAHPHSTLE